MVVGTLSFLDGKIKESRLLFNALNYVKWNENETLDGFSSRFDKLVHNIPLIFNQPQWLVYYTI